MIVVIFPLTLYVILRNWLLMYIFRKSLLISNVSTSSFITLLVVIMIHVYGSLQEIIKILKIHCSIICLDSIANCGIPHLSQKPPQHWSAHFFINFRQTRTVPTYHFDRSDFWHKTDPAVQFFSIYLILRRYHLHIQHKLIQKGCARAWKGPRTH